MCFIIKIVTLYTYLGKESIFQSYKKSIYLKEINF